MDERERLKSEFARLRRLVKLGARILLLGLGVEIIVLLIFAKGKPWCETASFIVSVIVVIAGVWIEESAGSQAEDVAEELQRLSDEEIARSTERAADANRIAEEARLELAKYREPRVLDPRRSDQFVEKLRSFSNCRYDFSVGQIAPEYVALVSSVEVALEKAGWVGVDNESTPTGLRRDPKPRIGIGAKFEEVKIGVPTEALAAAGAALAEALTAEGIQAEVIPPPEDALPPQLTSAIHILIGPKK